MEKFTNDIQSESEEYFSDEAEERASNGNGVFTSNIDYSPEGTDGKDSSPNMSALKSSSTANDSKYMSQLSMSKRLAKPKKSRQSKMLNRSVKKPPKYTKRNRSERKRASSITKMASEKHAGKDSVVQVVFINKVSLAVLFWSEVFKAEKWEYALASHWKVRQVQKQQQQI